MAHPREAVLLATSTRVLEFALSVASQRGALLTGSPLILLFTLALWRGSAPTMLPDEAHWAAEGVALVASLLVAFGARQIEHQGRRRGLLAGLVLGGMAMGPALLEAPGTALVVFLVLAGAFVWVASPDQQAQRRRRAVRELEAQRTLGAASLMGITVWLIAVAGGMAVSPLEWSVAAMGLVGWGLSVETGIRSILAQRRRWQIWALIGASVIFVAGIISSLATWDPAVAALSSVVPPLVALAVARGGALVVETGIKPWWTGLVEHPARFLVGTFLVTALVGGFVLSFPACSPSPRGIDLIDAMFTSFSATCVTGLAVVDTPTAYNGLGQAVILLLIQVGGLGIMTFSTAAFLLLGQRMSLRHEAAVAELIGSSGRDTIWRALKNMVAVTVVTELLGAVTLAILFGARGDTIGVATWRGLFTSISAFCNAGFALQSDSLVGYQHDPAVLGVISVLIIVGAMGPAVVVAIPDLFARRKLPVQARMVLLVTVALLVVPAAFILAAEWKNTLLGMDMVDRISNAWFQSVTLRTAGFNSLDLAAVTPATRTLMILLMFIGGSPGSTAGGVKTTTVMVLLLAVAAALRGRNVVTFDGWRIPHISVYKSAAITTMGVCSVIVALMLLQLTQAIPFESLLFETVSALATVGLSIGATGALDGVGKIIVIACMFMGRVGPLTLFLLLMTPDDRSHWKLPEQEIAVG